MAEGGKSFGLGWESKLPVPTVKDDTASYDLGEGQTLSVTALSQGFSENIELASAPDETPVYRIPLNLDGLKLSVADSGHLLLKDDEGKLVAEAPAPLGIGKSHEIASFITARTNLSGSFPGWSDHLDLGSSPPDRILDPGIPSGHLPDVYGCSHHTVRVPVHCGSLSTARITSARYRPEEPLRARGLLIRVSASP